MSTRSLGERIRELRGKLYTQRELAERAGVSIDLVRKLEQGARNTASVASLHKLALALDVNLADLVGRARLPEQDPAEGVTALRHAVSGVDDLLGEPPSADPLLVIDVNRELTYLWGAYWSGRYENLTALLPPVLGSLRASVAASTGQDRPRAFEGLAQGYWVAGCCLVHLRQSDAGFIAVRHALEAADKGNDPLLSATLCGALSWQLLVAGRFGESEALAVRSAERIEPRGEVPLPHQSVYGSLVITAATAAARSQKGDRARDFLTESAQVADQMGADRSDYNSPFGPSQVAMQSVDVGVQIGEYGQALKAAKTMPDQGAALPLAAQARHLTDRAIAHTKLGQYDKATALVQTAEQMAPNWAKHQTSIKSVIRDLLHTPRSSSTSLRALAGRLGVR